MVHSPFEKAKKDDRITAFLHGYVNGMQLALLKAEILCTGAPVDSGPKAPQKRSRKADLETEKEKKDRREA